MDFKHTCDTINTRFKGITDNIWFWKTLFINFSFISFYPSTHNSTRLQQVLPVQMMGGRVSA